jgi:hypothetical protein
MIIPLVFLFIGIYCVSVRISDYINGYTGSVANGRPGLWPADLPPCPQANARSLHGDAVSVAWWQSVQISVARQFILNSAVDKGR